MDSVPLFFHDVPLAQYDADQLGQNKVAGAEIQRDQHDDCYNNPGGSDGFLPCRPGHLPHLGLDVFKKKSCFIDHAQTPQVSVGKNMAGQEGFEPPTPGFGDRCSTVRATGLQAEELRLFMAAVTTRDLFRFFMGCVQPTKAAELLEFEFLRGTLLVLRGRIVSLLARGAGERDDVAHDKSF